MLKNTIKSICYISLFTPLLSLASSCEGVKVVITNNTKYDYLIEYTPVVGNLTNAHPNPVIPASSSRIMQIEGTGKINDQYGRSGRGSQGDFQLVQLNTTTAHGEIIHELGCFQAEYKCWDLFYSVGLELKSNTLHPSCFNTNLHLSKWVGSGSTDGYAMQILINEK